MFEIDTTRIVLVACEMLISAEHATMYAPYKHKWGAWAQRGFSKHLQSATQKILKQAVTVVTRRHPDAIQKTPLHLMSGDFVQEPTNNKNNQCAEAFFSSWFVAPNGKRLPHATVTYLPKENSGIVSCINKTFVINLQDYNKSKLINFSDKQPKGVIAISAAPQDQSIVELVKEKPDCKDIKWIQIESPVLMSAGMVKGDYDGAVILPTPMSPKTFDRNLASFYHIIPAGGKVTSIIHNGIYALTAARSAKLHKRLTKIVSAAQNLQLSL